jgi:peptidoglycan/xylan/chitin deacetylase (PgdA/CDA1 family)
MLALRDFRHVARRFVEREWPVILMYHRVVRVARDPWYLAVWPDRFAEQIAALVHVRRVVPLQWLSAELAQGRMPRKVAAITFDDGYADVLTEARPVLERYKCPATVFLVTGAIGSNRAFWWDELSRIVLEPPSLPSELEIEIADRVYRWRPVISPGSTSAEVAGCPDASKEQLHSDLWELLRPLEPGLRQEFLIRLGNWAGIQIEPTSAHRPLSAEEVGRLAEPGFIDIGAHTVTHPVLTFLDEAGQRSEIENSRHICEALIGQPIHAFAYPFGELDATSAACVREAGFACACTTQPKRVSIRNDLMYLPRFAVGNWDGIDFARKVSRGF